LDSCGKIASPLECITLTLTLPYLAEQEIIKGCDEE